MAQDASTFNWQAYLAANPDVAASSFGNQEGAWNHYINYGAREGRKATFDSSINAPQPNSEATFNWIDYLKNNPDVAVSSFGNQERAWEHYFKYGVKEGRQANFDLGSKNTPPSADQLQTDPNTGFQYSTTPGHVGYIVNVPVDPNNPDYGTAKQFVPSAFDFTGAKFDKNTNTYTMPSGEKIVYDFSSNNITGYSPVYDKATTVAQGSRGQTYSPTSGQRTANFQGLNLGTDIVNQGEFLVNPNTKEYYKDSNGNPIPVYHEPSSGGFGDWITENGWILPLAMAGVGAGAALAGGAAAGEGALGASGTIESLGTGGSFTPVGGASFAIDPAVAYTTGAGAADIGLGTNAPLQGPTYQELGVTGVLEGGMGPTYGELGYTGLNQNEAIAAADAAAKSGLSASDVLSNANRLKNIAKLLTGSESSPIFSKNTPTANQWAQQTAQNFAQYTPEQFGGYYQMNKNPFTFQNPLANALKGSSGLDVSGTGGQLLNTQGQAANLAKLLA